MKQHTDLTLAELQEEIRVLCEEQVTGTLMGSTNENKFFRIRLQEGVISHFIYGREYGLDGAEKFSLIQSGRYTFSDDLEMPFPEKSKIQSSDISKLFEALNLQISQPTSQPKEQDKQQAIVYRGRKSIVAEKQNKQKTIVYRGRKSVVADD